MDSQNPDRSASGASMGGGRTSGALTSGASSGGSEQTTLPFGVPGGEATPEEKQRAAKRLSREMMQRLKEKVDPDINDHGEGHVERVAQNLDQLRDTLEEIGITQQELGREHSEEETALQDVAAQLHDVGRGMPDRGMSHAISSGDLIRSDSRIPLKPWEREKAARYAELHSDKATRELYGTDDLNELVEKGVLTREEAYLVGEVRVADSLDVGKKRAETNTQGEGMNRVVERLKREPSSKNEAKLAHWYGHNGINRVGLKRDGDKLMLSFSLDAGEIGTHGAEVAYRIKDTLRDVNTTFLKGNYSVEYASRDPAKVGQWYAKYGYIFEQESSGAKAYVGRSD